MTKLFRCSAILVVLMLGVASCSGADSDVPGWVKNPPEYLSCNGLVNPQLVVDLIRAADLPRPESDAMHSEFEQGNPSISCSPTRGPGLSFGISPPYSLGGAFSPPDPLLVPIPELPGFVSSEFSYMWIPCTRDAGTVTLESTVLIEADGRRNPEVRLAMARLVVAVTNGARERFGCAEGPLPLPEKLPAIPDPGPVEHHGADSETEYCDADMLALVPGEDGVDPDDGPVWVYDTPGERSVLSTCEVRTSSASLKPGISGLPTVAVVTYRGVLAEAYRNSPEDAMPRYDIMCRGTPVSYRVYVDKPDDGTSRYVLADDYLMDELAGSAADSDGCSLDEK